MEDASSGRYRSPISVGFLIETHGAWAEADTEQAALVTARTLRFDAYHAAIMQGATLPAVTIYHDGRHALTIARGPNAQLDTFYPRREGA